ncbi:M67 family metallopeptidase [Deinococcus sp. KNUC1210]|uniref:Mov34/MPN/PAD-1 family protein n=1 Tax=Deinococcus sp. KNUC1210 TaxID=2917691 RepID=UPI001EF03AEC|nr:M67 family metallopeptidase [Deinococcus sp. KNUC1210]ULH16274.1 M67 family metallopeptidase [Deinococcus sp. KNUC1210]
MPLHLPRHLETALWEHVQREVPCECVGVIGAQGAALRALYPLRNIARDPAHRYLADPASLLRALRAMEHEGLTLAAIYHSHPHGRARPSRSDLDLAEYRVPYLIADVECHELRAYLLPQGEEVELTVE